MNTPLLDQIIEQLQVMPYDQQRHILEFTRALVSSRQHGVAGSELARFASVIPASDLQIIQEAIEQGCEQVETSIDFDENEAGV